MAQSKLTVLIDLSKKLFDSKLSDMQQRFGRTVKRMREDFRELVDEIPGMGRAMDLMTNKWVLLGAGAMALGSGLAKATTMANDWHTQMAEINVTAELSKDKLKGLSDQLLNIGARNVAPLEEVPKAFSRIISAGLDVNQSLEALEPTIRAAKAGFVDIETVASAGVQTMMASGEDINKVYDVLFETVKEGAAEFKDLAQYLPKVIPLAKNLGYELDETAGAYASLTTKLSAEQSTTSLQGIIRSLADERVALGQMEKDGTYKSGFKALGIDVHDATGKLKPLTEIIGMLNQKMEGLSDKQRMIQFSKLGLDQMSTLGFSTLMQDLEGLQNATDAVMDSQGALAKAYTDSLTPLEQWGLAQNNLKVTMIKIGEAILPLLAKAIEFITPLFEWIRENIEELIPIVGTFIGVLGLLTIGMWAFNSAVLANPITWFAVVIAGLIALVVTAIRKFDQWGAGILALMGPIGWVVIGIKTLYKHWDDIKKAFTEGGIIAGLKRIGLAILDMLLVPVKQLLEILAEIPGLGHLAGAGAAAIDTLRNKLALTKNDTPKPSKETKTDTENPFASTPTKFNGATFGNDDGTGTGSGTGGKLGKQVSRVAGDTTQSKNITVNVNTLANNTFEKGTTEGLTWQQVEERMTDILLRVIRNAELS